MTTTVNFNTSLGDVVITLFDADAPMTVNNFLNYANNMTIGAGYANSFFHRLVGGFVLQGGGFDYNPGTNSINAITTGAPVQNEFSLAHSNLERTVAMAKVGGDPNSATDQFFFNLGNNSANLDTQNGGFTVFGEVTAASWPVVQTIAMLPVVNAGSPFDQLPVRNYSGGNATPSNLVYILSTTITSGVACYAIGTLILTETGEVAVEALAIGDRLVTASGKLRPVRWIGHRRYAGRFVSRAVLPIRIAAGALGNGVPRRNLLVSPKHAMLLDGLLIPAEHLVDGTTIRQLDRAETVDYVHVELDSHDVILAEGAPSETFVDDGNRAMFYNAQDHAERYPHAPRADALYCAPRVESGYLLEAVRVRLATRVAKAA